MCMWEHVYVGRGQRQNLWGFVFFYYGSIRSRTGSSAWAESALSHQAIFVAKCYCSLKLWSSFLPSRSSHPPPAQGQNWNQTIHAVTSDLPVQLPPPGRASSKHSWYIWKGTKVSLEPWQRFYINVHPRLPCTNFWKQQDLWQGDSWPASAQAWPHKDCRTVPLEKQDRAPPPQLGPLREESHQE